MKKINFAHLVARGLNALAHVAPSLAGRIAFTLFCSPSKKTPKKEELNFLATADLTYETLDGRKYGVWHWGFKGPTALLVHGWESHSGRWRKMVPILLNAGYQVIAVDAPAHGRSDGGRFTMIEYAGIIRFLLQKYTPVDLVIGHSVGATSVAWALGTSGQAIRPKKVILLAPFTSLRYTLTKSVKSIGISDKLLNEAVKHIEKFFKVAYDDIDITHRSHLLSDIDTLIIHDRTDKVTAYTESELLHAAWPGSTLLLTEGFGHGLTAPEVYQTLEDFIVMEESVKAL